MKQTAVEWQFEQFFNSFEKFNNGECTFNEYLKRNLEIRKQAKEMEKEHIIEFSKVVLKEYKRIRPEEISTIKRLYNETFKQQEQ